MRKRSGNSGINQTEDEFAEAIRSGYLHSFPYRPKKTPPDWQEAFHALIVPQLQSTPIYWLLMSVGAWRGLISLVHNPFYWAKTEHGVSLPLGAGASPAMAMPRSDT